MNIEANVEILKGLDLTHLNSYANRVHSCRPRIGLSSFLKYVLVKVWDVDFNSVVLEQVWTQSVPACQHCLLIRERQMVYILFQWDSQRTLTLGLHSYLAEVWEPHLGLLLELSGSEVFCEQVTCFLFEREGTSVMALKKEDNRSLQLASLNSWLWSSLWLKWISLLPFWINMLLLLHVLFWK